MCLITFAYNYHPNYPLVLVANRDEFHHRPTQAMHYWPDNPDILAGRDSHAGGTWLGLTRQGKVAALTNYREPDKQKYPYSRGDLVKDFLNSDVDPIAFLSNLLCDAHMYAGFNLLIGNDTGLYYTTNRLEADKLHWRPLGPGLYGLCNHVLDTPWPKVQKAKQRLAEVLAGEQIHSRQLMPVMTDTHCPPDDELPDTGWGIEWERVLGPIKVDNTVYGTRSSCALLVDTQDRCQVVEHGFNRTGQLHHHEHFQLQFDRPVRQPQKTMLKYTYAHEDLKTAL